jgi:hypothetical protein
MKEKSQNMWEPYINIQGENPNLLLGKRSLEIEQTGKTGSRLNQVPKPPQGIK